MILFFPQYQAGHMPSRIPVGTDSLRRLWHTAPDFVEVPLEPTRADDPQIDGGIRFRHILRRQLMTAMRLVAAADPDFILTTGGDCGTAPAPIMHLNHHYRGKIGLLWIDAHADIHSPLTSPSGNFHGEAVRFLMGHDAFEIQPPLALQPEQLAYLGLRSTEPEEDAFIAENKILRYSTAEIAQSNEPLVAVLARFRAAGLTHLHLHVDCDVLDPAEFPHVHVPEPGGLKLHRLIEILQYLRSQMPLSGCCLTEYAPRAEGEGIETLKRIYTEGLGLQLPDEIG